ncbi:cold-regulated protein 27 [Malania oleifera]|uniref:cold-regulated protein 27 n=1 Tax=Malania oleifera TaxID=397392 RepID=UPI0025ADB711|nr:cold-regulated protein 27 [Malania oleifera]
MEANLEQDVTPPAPDLGETEDCRTELGRTSSVSSSLTIDNLNRGFPQNENARPGWSTEWTDEKHNSYLNSLEATFVNELHRSMGLLAWCSQEPNSYQLSADTPNSSHQFTVHQDGCWQKINFERNHSPLDGTVDSHVILKSPWVCHFRSIGKRRAVTYPYLQEHCASCSEVTHQIGKETLSCAATRRSEQLPASHLCHKVSIGDIAEVSGQNFIDEDQTERSSNNSVVKRSKTAAADANSKDKVVPYRKFHTKEASTTGNAQYQREEWMHHNWFSEKPDNLACPEPDVKFFLRGS